MSIHRLGIAALATAATLAFAALSQAGSTRNMVHGRFTPVPSDAAARGVFQLNSRTFDRGAVAERIMVECKKLDMTKVDDVRPEYHLWLTTADATASADVGALLAGPRGHGRFRFNSRLDAYPEGVDLISDFGGGTIEVRNGDTAVLTARIPAFDGAGALGVRHDTNRLEPPENGRGRGWIEARHVDRRRGSSEQMRIQITNLARSAAPYTAVAIADDTTETTLATLQPRGRYGDARKVIDTSKGGEIPGGAGLAGLSEQSVEIRDKDGNVVLSGVFPTITAQ